MTASLMPAYARLPVSFARGAGAWLWDTEGKKYLDALSGIAVCGLGHAHPDVAAAICDQAQRLVHTSNLYHIERQQQLADALVRVSRMDRVFFCNSGAEANEAAIKIARLFAHRKGIDQPEIIVADGSFHGRTLATLSATGNRKVQAGFEPLVQGFVRVPFDDIDALVDIARSNPNTVAVLLEPIQGEGGVVVPGDDYLNRVRGLCDEYGWLMMLDEVQTGVGRTGEWFAWHHSDAAPDVMTSAKALGNGVPIGACLARGDAAELIHPGSHATTFGGNPLACSAALAVLATMERDGLVERAARVGARLRSALAEALRGVDIVYDLRGKGLMVGIELTVPCADLVAQALAKGLLINVTAERVIRLLPPLVIGEQEIAWIAETLRDLVRGFSPER